jgi:hypothetical protein
LGSNEQNTRKEQEKRNLHKNDKRCILRKKERKKRKKERKIGRKKERKKESKKIKNLSFSFISHLLMFFSH